jgi:hypothetical protein
MAEDPLVIFVVLGLWGLGLMGLYALVGLAVWAWRTLWGLDWRGLWKSWSYFLRG